MEYEKAFSQAGTLGKGQFPVIFGTTLIILYAGWQSVLPVFVAIEVPFRCNESHSAGFEPVTYDSHSNDSFDSKCIENCEEYVYDSSLSSIVKDFDLACGSRKILTTIATATYWASYLISCFCTGYLGDRFGRKPINISVIFLFCVFSTISIFSPNIWFYIAMRFCCGFCDGGFVAMAFMIMVETVDRDRLALICMVVQVFLAVGEMVAAQIGNILKHSWRLQVAVVSAVLVPVLLLFIIFIPESPLWLYSKGRYREAEVILKKIAKLNSRDPSLVVLSDPSKKEVEANGFGYEKNWENDSPEEATPLIESSESNTKGTLFDLCGTYSTLMLTLSQTLTWFSSSVVYYGLTYNVGDLVGDIYLNLSLLALTEFPLWVLSFAMDKYGRKSVVSACLLFSSLACLGLPFTKPLAGGHFQIGFAIIGRCMAGGAYNTLYVYTPELYPTILRSTGLLFCTAAARVGTILAPFVGDIHYGVYDCAPYVIFSAVGLVSSIFVTIFGRETRNKPLLNNIEQFRIFAKRDQTSATNSSNS